MTEENKQDMEKNNDGPLVETTQSQVDTVHEEPIPKETSNLSKTEVDKKPPHFSVPIGSEELFSNLITAMFKTLNKLQREENETGSGEEIEVPEKYQDLISCIDSPTGTAEAVKMTKVLCDIKDDVSKLKSMVNKSILKGDDLKGRSAITAFAARGRGVKKIYLYGSGFHIVVTPFTLEQLASFFESVADESKELGRTIGYYKFLYNDVFVKERFLHLVKENIIECNLANWKNGNKFLKCLMFNSIEQLVLEMTALMYRDPVNIKLKCLECNNVVDEKYDISNLLLINNNCVTPEAIEFLHKEDRVDEKELIEYRKLLNGYSDSIDCIINVEGSDVTYTYDVEAASALEYIKNGKARNAKIIKSITGANSYENRETLRRTIMEFNSNYIPWIKHIKVSDGINPPVGTSDKEIFPEILMELGHDDRNKEFHDRMGEFIYGNTSVAIGMGAYNCTSCGELVGDVESGYVAWDPMQLFFVLARHSLAMAGLQ